ncbi:Bbp16 family capsid cement protein [Arsenophonus sp. PmNCSU2021_1]|uniref:Bbp16 family capsid cement protein n=1 Tax=Arsenophonus sp. PmNCSU2021_1 TaxID=3118989 RepID=UPI002FF25A5E
MILDKETLFSLEQAVTTTGEGTNTLNLAPISGDFRDIGLGEPLELFVQVIEQANAAGNATVQFILQTAKKSDFSDAKSLFESVALPVADLKAGKRIVNKVPSGSLKYLRLRYVVTEGPLTAGKFTAGINLTVDAHPIYHAVSQ